MRGDYSEFGQAVRQSRRRESISQRALAAALNIDFTYLSKIETGAGPPPSESVIRAMAEILHEDTDELIRLSGNVPTDVLAFIRGRPDVLRELRLQMSGRPVSGYLSGVKCPSCDAWFDPTQPTVLIPFPTPESPGESPSTSDGGEMSA